MNLSLSTTMKLVKNQKNQQKDNTGKWKEEGRMPKGPRTR